MKGLTMFVRQLIALVGGMPRSVADSLDRFLLDIHAPVDAGLTHPLCAAHRPLQEWPCDEWTRAADRLSSRQQ